jgi:hypothetical protein
LLRKLFQCDLRPLVELSRSNRLVIHDCDDTVEHNRASSLSLR